MEARHSQGCRAGIIIIIEIQLSFSQFDQTFRLQTKLKSTHCFCASGHQVVQYISIICIQNMTTSDRIFTVIYQYDTFLNFQKMCFQVFIKAWDMLFSNWKTYQGSENRFFPSSKNINRVHLSVARWDNRSYCLGHGRSQGQADTNYSSNTMLLFQRNIYSHSVDSEDQKIIPSYPFKWWFSLLYENSFPGNFTINSNICYMVKNKMRSAQSAAPTLTSTKTALNYLHQPDFNKVQLITDWILTGQWQCNQTRAAHQYCLKDDDPNQIAPFLHFSTPVVALHVNDKLLYGIIDTGCATLLCSRGYYQQFFRNETLLPYLGNKYQQANADDLPIVGVLSCSFQLGTLLTKEKIPIFESPLSHRELLIGWIYLKENNLTISPSGLYRYPSIHRDIAGSPQDLDCNNIKCRKQKVQNKHKIENKRVLKPRAMEIPAHDDCGQIQYNDCGQIQHDDCGQIQQEQILSPPSNTIFEVQVAESVSVLPKQQILLKCKIKNLTQEDLQLFESCYMVFSSENIEPWQSLLNLSIFFQLLPITTVDQTIQLVYFNDNPNTVFLYQNDIVAQCEPMQYAGDTDCVELSKLNPAVFFAGAILECPQTNIQSLKSPSCSHLELNFDDDYEVNKDDIFIRNDDPIIQQEMTRLIQQYKGIFGRTTWSVNSWGSTFQMEARPSVTPHVAPRIPVPEKIREQSRQIINILLQRGLIVPSKSPWRNSILFLLKKKNQNKPGNEDDPIPLSRIRVVLDFRRTNESLLQTWTSQPLPLIEELLANMHHMKVISTADLSQGFFGCKLHPEKGQQYTAFEHEGRLYQWTRLLQGASPSAPVFNSHVQRLIWDNHLHPDQRKDDNNNYTSGVTNYLDDLAICSVDQQSHFQILKELFEVLKKHRIKLKLPKSTWFIQDKVDFLGFSLDIRHSTLQPSKANIEKILRIKEPRTKKQIKSALGSFGFFHNLLPNFAERLAPLFEVLQLDKPFQFGEQQRQAFKWAVSSLAKLPIVYLLDLSRPIYGVCDGAQHNSISYCVLQFNKRLNSFVPCKWNSHRLNKAQMNYSQVHVEALSLSVYCSENYPLLLYRRSYIFNDSHCLSFIAKFRFQNVALYRLHLLISSCNLYFKWLPASNSVVTLVDMLTRPPLKKSDQAPMVLKQRLTQALVDRLPFANFDGMPELSYTQTLELLDSFHQLCDKLGPDSLREKWQVLLKQQLPPPAKQTVLLQGSNVNLYFDNCNNTIGLDPFVQVCTRINTYSTKYSYVQQVHNCTKGLSSMIYIDQLADDTDEKKKEGPSGGQRKTIQAQRGRGKRRPPPVFTQSKLHSFLQAEGKLHCYFPSFQLQNLINEQLKDDKLLSQIKSHPNDFIQIKQVYCKKTQYKGLTYYPICWPSHLNTILLQKSHVVNNLLHLRKDKLLRQLKPFFYIRNFNAAFDSLNCNHCEMNIKHKNVKIPLGITFNVKQCRTFISIDCCTVDSSMEYGSFLLVADICSYYVLAFPCKQTPTAAEIYQLIFTGWSQAMGIPIAIQADGGLSSQLAHDIATMFNIRQYFISPYNSRASRVELIHRYILANLKGAQQCGFLSEQSFPLWLSLSALLWNSTTNLDGISPSQLQFQGATTRTHQFVTLSNLKTHQNRSFLTQQFQEATYFLSMVSLRRKQLNMQKKGQLEAYNSKIHVGDIVLRQRIQTKQARWKLKTKYFPQPYRVVISRTHYCILMPLDSPVEYISSPYLKGTKLKKKGIRVSRPYLKKLKNPYDYLNLSKGIKHLEAAAELLGSSRPVRQIILGPPLPLTKTNHPFYKQFAQPPGYQQDDSVFRSQNTVSKNSNTDLCFSQAPVFVSDIYSNRTRIDQFVGAVKAGESSRKIRLKSHGILKGNSHYVYILSKNYSFPRSVQQENTVSYRYQGLYEDIRRKHLLNRMDYLRQIQSALTENGQHSQQMGTVVPTNFKHSKLEEAGRHFPGRQKKHFNPYIRKHGLFYYQDDPLENFDPSILQGYSDSCIYIKKSDIFPIIISKIRSMNNDHQTSISSSSSDDNHDLQKRNIRRPAPNLINNSTSTESSSSSQSYRSVISLHIGSSPVNQSDQDRISTEARSTSHRQTGHESESDNESDGSFLDSGSSQLSIDDLNLDRIYDFSDDDFNQTIKLKEEPVASDDDQPYEGQNDDLIPPRQGPQGPQDLGQDVQYQGQVVQSDQNVPQSPHVSIQHPGQISPIVDSIRKTKKSKSRKSRPIPIPLPSLMEYSGPGVPDPPIAMGNSGSLQQTTEREPGSLQQDTNREPGPSSATQQQRPLRSSVRLRSRKK